ncbi:hypothetical protein [Geminocystis herdmanii]|uniref:hypothetical protein n=1 Tax=Geminocystis herdmanii TaxID=669359 RepID=UPI000377E9DD|nr:hypothetical protein [Geminocystis herdmanii]
MAYLQSRETKKNSLARLESKLNLVRLLYQKGYTKEMVIQLFRLIDWLMILPKELKEQFQTELINYEEENKMPYITSIEEIGMEKGEQLGKLKNAKESVIEALEIRFENVPKTIVNSLNQINDLLYLKKLHKKAILIDSLVNFELLLHEQSTNN